MTQLFPFHFPLHFPKASYDSSLNKFNGVIKVDVFFGLLS